MFLQSNFSRVVVENSLLEIASIKHGEELGTWSTGDSSEDF